MRDVKRILVPTDFSECSLLALERASELAKSFGAQVTLLHVYDNPPFITPDLMVGYTSTAMGQTLVELMHTEAEAEFEQFAKRAAEKDVVIDAQKLVRGEPVAAILRIATDEDFDLIVMGTHGRTGLSHVLLGSIAERVLRRSDRPVLTVRAPHEKKAA